jgi:GntR family phosphonate transport system transcriptional regulator
MALATLDSDCGVALYRQIGRVLEEEIRRAYEPGAQLAAEGVLARRFGVNRHTIRHAVDELVATGLIERRRGVGMFVVRRAIDYGIGKDTRFTETLEAAGNTTESSILRKHIVRGREPVNQRLELARGSAVLWIETLRKVNDRPFCVISHFLPLASCRAAKAEYSGGSLHRFLRDRLGLDPERRRSHVSAQLASRDDAALLGIGRTQPILLVKTVNVDAGSREPIEYAVTRFRGDMIQLEISL